MDELKIQKNLEKISNSISNRKSLPDNHQKGIKRSCLTETMNTNLGECPYCPRKNLKSINIHIGHMHKCKNCRELFFDCSCKD
jgi:hypothetical protein